MSLHTATRKILLLIALFTVTITCVYFIFPARFTISSIIKIPATSDGVFRNLAEKKAWLKWWPGKRAGDSSNNITFLSDSYRFNVTKTLYNSFNVSITKNSEADTSVLQIFSLGTDSVKIAWTVELQSTSNPFSKIALYLKARSLKGNMTNILSAMQRYFAISKNIYGIDIKEETKPLQYLVSTKRVFLHVPTTEDVYEIIKEINTYVKTRQGITESYPMLHVLALDSNKYEAHLAVPVKESIPGNATFVLNSMPGNAKFLVGEVKGGNENIEEAIREFKLYVADYQKTVMASPFQLLVTDRTKEMDSTKWVTKIYYPIK